MKIRLFILTILLPILFLISACSSKSSFFSEDLLEKSAIVNSKKGQLYSSLEIKSTIVATYLNPILPKYRDSKNEFFLIGVFIDKDSPLKSERGLYNSSYTLNLDGKKPINIKELESHHALIRMIPIKNQWSHYYLVEFKSSLAESIKMSFKNEYYGEILLEFEKDL